MFRVFVRWILAATAAMSLQNADAKPIYTSFDVLAAENYVTPTKITNDGWISGHVSDSNWNEHGFIRDGDGILTTFDVPGATDTFVEDMNEKHEVVGGFYDPNTGSHGFLRSAKGKLSIFDVPGAGGTYPHGINAMGYICGDYYDGMGETQAFVRSPNGDIQTISYSEFGTNAFGINKDGVITGSYSNEDGAYGYLRALDGTVTIFKSHLHDDMHPLSVNNLGSASGYAYDFDNGDPYAFLRNSDGTMTKFRLGQTEAGTETYGRALNDRNDLVGNFFKQSSAIGFVRYANGAIKRIVYPAAVHTIAYGINDNRVIVGGYKDSAEGHHGFIRTP